MTLSTMGEAEIDQLRVLSDFFLHVRFTACKVRPHDRTILRLASSLEIPFDNILLHRLL